MSYKTPEEIFANNIEWVERKKANDPDYFINLAKGQSPAYLWIGCSDSRIPPNQLTGTEPGEIFIHRNIANMVVATDLNMLSVLEYAVSHLHVKEVIVCGHYNCGGIKAAMGNSSLGLLDGWLSNIKSVYRLHANELDAIEDTDKRADRLAELNVQEQVHNLAHTSIIQKAWKQHKTPAVHGWIYDLYTGHLKNIYSLSPDTELNDIYGFTNL